MAGMDWFRWHHGSVTDPKFQLVAKKSGTSVAEVVALWAFALEEASLADDRGSILGLDVESVECLLGLDDGKGTLILEAMEVRGLIADGRIASWDKRQPSREREDDTAAERKRKQREREAMSRQEQPIKTNVTPSHTMSHQETPREEKSREENKQQTNSFAQIQHPAASPIGFAEFWTAYPKKKSKGAAEKVWKRIKPDLQIVLQAIERAKTSADWLKEQGQFIPHPATWLNAKGWEDEIVPISQSSQSLSKPWFLSSTGIEEEAKRRNITMQDGEVFPYFKQRVYQAAGITPDMIRSAQSDFGARQ